MNDLMRVQHALSFIDSNDRDIWVNVGNAIKGEFGENGFDTWLDWSADAASFNKKSAVSVWKSLKRLVVPNSPLIALPTFTQISRSLLSIKLSAC